VFDDGAGNDDPLVRIVLRVLLVERVARVGQQVHQHLHNLLTATFQLRQIVLDDQLHFD
jgi:hypothetical protein